MGLLQFLGRPIRQLLVSEDAPQLATNFKNYGTDSKLLFGFLVFGLLMWIACVVAFFWILFKTKKLLNKGRNGERQDIPKSFIQPRRSWIILAVIFVNLSIDGIWSSLMITRLSSINSFYNSAIDAYENKRSSWEKAAPELDGFISGTTSLLAMAGSDIHAISPLVIAATRLVEGLRGIAEYSKKQLDILSRTYPTAATIVPGLKNNFADLNAQVDRINGFINLKDLAASLRSFGGDKGVSTMVQKLPSITQHKDMLSIFGIVAPALGLTYLVTLLLGALAVSIGLYYGYRPSNSKMILASVAVVAFLMPADWFFYSVNLATGTVFGAVCDTLEGRQGVSIQGERISLSNLSQVMRSCSDGYQLPRALYDGIINSSTGSFNPDLVTADPSKEELAITVGGINLKFPINSKSIDYTSVVRNAIASVKTPSFQTQIQGLRSKVSNVSSKLKLLDPTLVGSIVASLKTNVDGINNAADTAKAAGNAALHSFILKIAKHLDAEVASLKLETANLSSLKTTASSSLNQLNNFLLSKGENTDGLAKEIQDRMSSDAPGFVTNTLVPAMTCTDIGEAAGEVIWRTCRAANGMQALFLGFLCLAVLSFSLIRVMQAAIPGI